jgi:hypothetical protein
MGDVIDARCCNCEIPAARVDENGWCEQCWLDLGASHQLFHDLEELVKQTLDTGVLTPAQLQEALRMSVEDSAGVVLAGTGFRRESVETEERGVWEAPRSLLTTRTVASVDATASRSFGLWRA